MGVNAFDVERRNRRASDPSRITVGTTAATILADNENRKGLIVVNAGITVIKLTLGNIDPTQTVYHVSLQACTALDDGTGGYYFDDVWTEDVRAISSASGGIVLVTEFS